jgi:hypothetical protein
MKSPTPIQAATIPWFSDGRAKDKSRDRIRNPVLSEPKHSAMTRAYLRELRAAEMKAWEMTGGDYLTSEAAAECRIFTIAADHTGLQ